ncbi:MAG: alpha/beta fold hydrolase [Acidobacteria bacterium]|nr:alpha/beta fold hydrolase [Acidobacteriota bacterium]
MNTTPVLTPARGRAAAGLLLVSLASACAQATQTPPATTAAAPAATAPATTQKPAAPAAGAATAPAAAAAPAAKTPTIKAADGTVIAYEKTGSGPPVLLLHGGGQTRKSWAERGYTERLAKRFTVISMDMRGSGESGRPETAEGYALDRVIADVLAVADAAGAPRFQLVGFGHGGTIARYLAVQSDRVISAVIISADMGPTVSGAVKEAMLSMRAKWQPLLEQQKAGTFDVKKLSPGDRDAWNNGIARSALALGALAEYPPVEPTEIKATTLWLIGSADTGALENAKPYEGKLAGTKVTMKQVSGLSYSDTFYRTDAMMTEIEPFLIASGGSN